MLQTHRSAMIGGSILWLGISISANSHAADPGGHELYASLSHPVEMPEFTRRSRTAADRWRTFETEFGIHQPHPSPVLRPIQSLKYEVDATLFAVDEFVDVLEDSLSFEYHKGRWRNVAAHEKTDSQPGWFGNPRLRVNINPLPGKPHLEVRVVIPFGN